MRFLALLLVLGAFGVLALGEPTVEDRLARLAPEVNLELQSRDRHIDPGELLELMHNNRIALRIVDVRREADFNLFHLRDAERWVEGPYGDAQALLWAPAAVKVVMGNDEVEADRAYRRLRALGVLNVYVLAGGVNGWLDAYDTQRKLAPGALQYRFERALGSRRPAADPVDAPKRAFEPKVKVSAPAAAEGGGCG